VNRFDRQQQIPSWDQQRLSDTTVLVIGRDWVGTFAVWGFASMGIGRILWVGKPHPQTEGLARWFLADPPRFSGCSIFDYPFEIDYGQELAWVVGDRPPDVVIHGAETLVHPAVMRLAGERRIPLLVGSTAGGGWYGFGSAPQVESGAQQPTVAMAVAALLADSAREARCPLLGGRMPSAGSLGLDIPPATRQGHVVLVGAGGIGAYAAVLAVLRGYSLTIVDFDVVEASNLNRQGLFTTEDADRRVPKALASKAALDHLFPGARVCAVPRRFDHRTVPELTRIRPSVLLSAVDNADSRLSLADFGCALKCGVVQCGTGLFLADCYTQEPGGPTLDAQMHHALTRARAGEMERRDRPSCATQASYVVPGMMAGALMIHRMVQHLELYQGLPPIHWRAGNLPVEERNSDHGHAFAGSTS
jgi:molybdopterin/thiamine biosynthesis adenylyltransferase